MSEPNKLMTKIRTQEYFSPEDVIAWGADLGIKITEQELNELAGHPRADSMSEFCLSDALEDMWLLTTSQKRLVDQLQEAEMFSFYMGW